MRKDFLARLFSVVSGFSLLVNSIVYPFAIAYAQEADQTPAPETQATIEPTSVPTDEPVVTPSPDITITPETTPAPVEEVLTPTPEPTETPVIETTVSESNQSEAPPSEEPAQVVQESATPEPTVTPVVEENGKISATILQNTQASSVDEFDLSFQTESSAVIVTDKGDYAPTDTVLITGTGFIAGKIYDLLITGTDNFSFSDKVAADENGNMFYAFQLDGIYRPDYKVEIKSSEEIIAEATFTDGVPNFSCVDDSSGANDEPGQKDLTRMCRDINSTNPLSINWNWDVTSMGSGNNSADACSLFDTDNDGFANYSLCVTWKNNQNQVSTSPNLYVCDDDRVDRCNGATLATISNGSTCTVANTNTDPFSSGDSYPNDTIANCSINLADVGGTTKASLLDVCSYPSVQPNSDPSDCIVIRKDEGLLTVIKDVVPNDLTTNWVITGSGASGFTENILGGDGSILKAVPLGTYTITESAGNGTSLSNYTSTWSCSKNGAPYLSGTGTSASGIVLEKNGNVYDSVVCTFTNTIKKGTIIVEKQTDPDQSLGDFTFTGNASGTIADGGQIVVGNLNPGTYSATETDPSPAYLLSSITCDDATSSIPSTVSLASRTATFNVEAGETVKCVFNNTLQNGTLTLVKSIINDNLGTKVVADFPLFIGTTPAVSGTPYTLPANVEYTVSETNQFGYAPSVWGGDCSADGKITLLPGENKTCTITNDDIQPKLTVTKIVTNDNGGNLEVSDFPLFVGGTSVTSGQTNGFNAGTYTVSETGKTGYLPSFGGACEENGSVILAVGDEKACTITNNDVAPKLTVIKDVDNSNGGEATSSDFSLTVGGNPVTSGVSYEYLANHAYVINETGAAGYSFDKIVGSAKCPANLGGTVTLAPGDDITCTITNKDIAPSITLIKSVIKDNGGTAGVNDFGLSIGAVPVTSGQKLTLASNTPYIIDEVGLAGYAFSTITGDTKCPLILGDTITLDPGEDIVCTIVNDDIAPTLTLVKEVVLDNGGDALASDWTLQAADPNNLPDSFYGYGIAGPNPVKAGVEYVIGETGGPSGYSSSAWVCDGGTVRTTTDRTYISIPLDTDVTCTITNDDIPSSLTVIKHVINNSDGVLSAGDFEMNVTGTNVSDSSFPGDEVGTTVTLDAGSYSVSETGGAGVYTQLTPSADCSGTIAVGETKTCTITNDDIDFFPSISVIKSANVFSVNEPGGNATFIFTVTNESSVDPVTITSLSDSVYGTLSGDSDCQVGTILAVGDSCSFDITRFVGGDASDPDHSNTFTAHAQDNEGNDTSASDGENVGLDDVLPLVDLVKEVTPSSLAEPGGVFTYSLTITNNSVEPVVITALTDTNALSAECVGLIGNTLAAGASTSCTYTVSQNEAGSYSNTANVTVEDNENNPVSDTDGKTVTVRDALPQVAIDKIANPSSLAEPGGDFNYTLTITNNSVEEVTITDLSDTNALSAECLALIGTTLASGAGTSCTYTITHNEAGVYDNTASITVQDNELNSAGDTDDERVLVTDVLPSVAITKDVTPSSLPEPGGIFTYTLTITNNSVEDVTITDLTDTNPLSAECLALIGTTLASGASTSCSYTIAQTEAGTYDNTASVTVEDNENNPASDSDDERVTVTDVLPLVELTKDVTPASLAEPGGVFTYTLTVTNNSVEPVEITNLTDDNALSAECLGLIGDTLAVGASTSCTYTVSHSDAGSYDNTAEVTVEDNEGNLVSDNDTETVRVSDELPSVSLDKSVDISTMTEPGGDFTFTLTITNNSVESISITDLTDNNALSAECLDLIGTLVLPGNSISCTYVVNHSLIGIYDNTAEVTAYDNEENRTTSSDDESVTITQEDKPELTLTKTNDKPNVSEGDTINYTLKVKNTGNVGLGNFEIIDVLPGGFGYITDSSLVDGLAQEPTVNGGILTWTISEGIAVDQEVVVTYQVKVGTNLDPGIYTNLASCRTVVRKEETLEEGPFLAAFVLVDQINNDIDCECNNGDPVSSSTSIGGELAYSGALTPQVLGASTELPATGSSTWYLLLITMVALSGIGLKVAGRKLKNEIN